MALPHANTHTGRLFTCVCLPPHTFKTGMVCVLFVFAAVEANEILILWPKTFEATIVMRHFHEIRPGFLCVLGINFF